MRTLAEYAVAYARLGWSIIPIKTRDKKPLVRWEKYQSEKATEDQVESWWKKWPEANIGIVTGLISDIIVIDIDSATGQENYIVAFDELHSTISQKTGKPNSTHLFFKHPKDQKYANATGFLPDVDVRADGGYVVAAPSIHPNKTKYKWVIDPTEMGLDDLMDLPDSLKEKLLVQNDIETFKNPEGWVQEALMGVEKGKRTDTCAKLAGYYLRLFSGDIEQTEIILESWNERNNPPKDWKSINKTIKSIADREGREALGRTVGEKISRIQILKYPPPDNTRRYRVFLADYSESVEMDTTELVMFTKFKIKFCELTSRIPRPVKQLMWESMVNKALSEAEVIQLTVDETLTGLILRLINSEVYSEGVMNDIKWIGSRIVVNGDIIYLRMEVLLNMANAEKERITRKDIGRILRAVGFRNEERRAKGMKFRCWFRAFDRMWRESFAS